MTAATTSGGDGADATETSTSPGRGGLVLLALILVAAVANLNLAVANVALPDIGKHFDASQTQLNLVAVGYSLGLAASVLYLGALGDRYGRKMMLVLGVGLSIPACILAATAPNIGILIAARILGGVAAGMAYPTTLALITALWSGPARTRSIALWSALGGAISALGPLVSGALLEKYYWGSVFLVTLPLAAVALVMAVVFVPSHVNETSDPVDNLGGLVSVVMVGSLVIAINFASVPNKGTLVLTTALIALASAVAFVIRQRRAREPLYDLHVAGRRIFWVAACAGIIVFGALMAAMFIGQQYLQNVLGYSTLSSGAAILPAAVCMVFVAPRSAKLIESHGSRVHPVDRLRLLPAGLRLDVALLERRHLVLGGRPRLCPCGYRSRIRRNPCIAFAHQLRSRQAGRMASGTADLQRDLGGALMQSLLGSLLTAGYAAAFTASIAASPEASSVSDSVQSELTKSFSSAALTAEQYPQYASQIIGAARTSFIDGSDWAYLAGVVAIVIGAALVFFMFPRRDDETRLLAEYEAMDTELSAH